MYLSPLLSRLFKSTPLLVLSIGLGMDGVVVESGERWLQIVSLSHVEILSKTLISAPPIGMDHSITLLLPGLMEIGVSNIVLLSVCWESDFTVVVIPVLI